MAICASGGEVQCIRTSLEGVGEGRDVLSYDKACPTVLCRLLSMQLLMHESHARPKLCSEHAGRVTLVVVVARVKCNIVFCLNSSAERRGGPANA